MAGMQRAHGRNEGDAVPCGAVRSQRVAKRVELTDGLHGPNASGKNEKAAFYGGAATGSTPWHQHQGTNRGQQAP
ncbi:hypothetical protein GCM10009095_07000 [Sphingomonas molluscorum]|nr:hypothetical protein GCM10017606_17450 [Microbacterium terregens]